MATQHSQKEWRRLQDGLVAGEHGQVCVWETLHNCYWPKPKKGEGCVCVCVCEALQLCCWPNRTKESESMDTSSKQQKTYEESESFFVLDVQLDVRQLQLKHSSCLHFLYFHGIRLSEQDMRR